ncbi:MAG TPA: aldehyde dehydrogenase family protein [Phycisphaerales bacterium]|nr:aldehyde dehydrogenase family protein [Phycisphaerales bacterium]
MTTHHEIPATCHRAAHALAELSHLPTAARAAILDSIAASLDARRDDVLSTCAEETALTIDELTPEFARMTGTLRMFANLIREGSWVRAAIDTPSADHLGPNHDLRKLLVPLGPVAVFGSSNFPLAYGVCGGDTASALAAGCPVIVKEHPAHPRTGRLLAGIAQEAIGRAGFSAQLLGYVLNEDPKDHSTAEQLLRDFSIAAVGFTGSIPGGLAIERIARERDTPIPVFAEMGSNNIIVVTGRAATARTDDIAAQLAESLLQRFGQQCTSPGTILVELGDAGSRFTAALAERIRATPGRDMLAPWIKSAYERRIAEVSAAPGIRDLARGAAKPGQRGSFACLLELNVGYSETVAAFRTDVLRDEIFGPAAIIVRLPIDMIDELRPRGSLSYSIFGEPDDVALDWTWDAALATGTAFAGRIIFNGPPTGVRVATAMVHGGPFPATNRPETTAVGPLAIERWCRPICFQNAPDALLPPELRNANPLGIWRTANGQLSKSPVA